MRFIKDFSRLVVPMMRLTRNEVKLKWDDLCEKAFQEWKRRLALAPTLIVLERGRGTQCIVMPQRIDWDVF